jgi:hypothetical protein
MFSFTRSRLVLPLVCVGAMAFLLPENVRGHEGDVAIKIIDNKIVVGDWIVDGVTLEPCPVFAGRFNDTGENPNWTDEPGFDSAVSTWPVPSSVSFNILDAVRVWDGSDFDEVASQQIRLSYASQSAVTPTTPSTAAGFSVGVSSSGAWHRHLGIELLDSTYVNGFAADGIYQLKIELLSSDASIGKSDPFYLVLRQDENPNDGIGTLAQHEAAVGYLESVPEPGSVVMLFVAVVAVLGAMWRRRLHK